MDKDLDIKDAVDHNLQETRCLYNSMDIDDVFFYDLTLDTDQVDSNNSSKFLCPDMGLDINFDFNH